MMVTMAADDVTIGTPATGYENYYTQSDNLEHHRKTRSTTEFNLTRTGRVAHLNRNKDGLVIIQVKNNTNNEIDIGKDVGRRDPSTRKDEAEYTASSLYKSGGTDANKEEQDRSGSYVSVVTHDQTRQIMLRVESITALNTREDYLPVSIDEPPPKPPWPPPWPFTFPATNSKRSTPTITNKHKLQRHKSATEWESMHPKTTPTSTTRQDHNYEPNLHDKLRQSHPYFPQPYLPPAARKPATKRKLETKFLLPPPPWLLSLVLWALESCRRFIYKVPSPTLLAGSLVLLSGCVGREFDRSLQHCWQHHVIFPTMPKIVDPSKANNKANKMNVNNNEPGENKRKRNPDDKGEDAEGEDRSPASVANRDAMDIEGGEEDDEDINVKVDLMDKFVGRSKGKTAGKEKATTFAAGVKEGVDWEKGTVNTIEFVLPRSKNTTLVKDFHEHSKGILAVIAKVVGNKKTVGFRALDSKNSKKIVLLDGLKKMKDVDFAQEFVGNEILESAKKKKKDGKVQGYQKLFNVNGKKESTFKMVLMVISLSDFTQSLDFYKELADRRVGFDFKPLNAARTKKDLVIFQAANRGPRDETINHMKSSFVEAVREGDAAANRPYSPTPEISIVLAWAPANYKKMPHIDGDNKKVFVIEYDEEDEARIKDALKYWKRKLRRLVGRLAYVYIVPQMNDPNLGDAKKQEYGGRCEQSAALNQTIIYTQLHGFMDAPGSGLDAELSLETTDGTIITTTVRDQLMGLTLPRLRHRNNERPVIYALFNTFDGVEVAIPNSQEYKDFVNKRIAVSPAAFILFHWMEDLDVTQGSMLAEIEKVFEPEYVKLALNNIDRDNEGNLFFLRGSDSKNSNEEEMEFMELDWIQITSDRISHNDAVGQNDFQNGDLYDFDETSDNASAATNAYVQQRYGHSFLERAASRNNSGSAPQAGAGSSPKAPPRDKRVVEPVG